VEVLETRLDGPLLLQPRTFADERGFFLETYRRELLDGLGIEEMVQDNHSRSSLGVLRGMHFQMDEHGAAKLVRCARGAILDVVCDLRVGSPTFGEWEAHVLDDENLRLLYVPTGFGHGFCVTSEVADVLYRQSAYYDPVTESEISYRDPDLAIAWPEGLELKVSERDERAPLLADVVDRLPFGWTAP
jgi:dTDP-4-dehydrorhamnose 3,5-epimerase